MRILVGGRPVKAGNMECDSLDWRPLPQLGRRAVRTCDTCCTLRSATVPVGYPLYVEVGYGAVWIPVGVTRWSKMVPPDKIGHGSLRPERVGVGYGADGTPVAR